MKFEIAVVLLFLSALPAAAAQEEKSGYLEARYEKVACGIDFKTDILKATAEKVLQASDLVAYAETLSSDKAKLQTLAAEGTAKAFREYLQAFVRPHMKEAKKALKEDRKQFRHWDVSNETVAELRDEYQESRVDLKECREAAVLQVGEAKTALYEAHLAKKEARTQNLSARGVDTAGMQAVIADAWTMVVAPLREAVSTGDPETVKNALRTYHLFNGGDESGISYHFAAKYQVSRLGAVTAAVAPDAREAGYGDTVTEIQEIADSTGAMLSGIADRKYAPGEGEEVWSNIRHGFSLLRGLVRSLRA